MMQKNIPILSAIAAGLLWLALAPSAPAAELKIYAGPQSIAPRGIIYVTVQTQGHEGAVELFYTADSGPEMRRATPEHGLVSFEVPANAHAGNMQFIAKSKGHVSDKALVFIHPAQPQNFTLSIKPGQRARTIDVASKIITDAYNNPIADLAFVSLEWIDAAGLKASQTAHLMQGRIISTVKCPRNFEGVLRLRAAINTAEYISPDIAHMCSPTAAREGEMIP